MDERLGTVTAHDKVDAWLAKDLTDEHLEGPNIEAGSRTDSWQETLMALMGSSHRNVGEIIRAGSKASFEPETPMALVGSTRRGVGRPSATYGLDVGGDVFLDGRSRITTGAYRPSLPGSRLIWRLSARVRVPWPCEVTMRPQVGSGRETRQSFIRRRGISAAIPHATRLVANRT